MTTVSNTKDLSFKLEIKQDDDTLDFVTLEGLASTFGNIDRTGDVIERGAFKNTIKLMKAGERVVRLLNQHRMDQPIGIVDSLKETEAGLLMVARMPRENSMVKDMLPLLKMGALSDFSIGFNIAEAENLDNGNRVIKEVDLWEVSVVTIPANEKAKITSVKKDEVVEAEKAEGDDKIVDAMQAESITTKKEFEQMLKGTGLFTKKAAITLASKFNDNAGRSDSDLDEKGRSDSVDSMKLLMEAINQTKKTLNKED
jgi:HK97 family phage prohead protease